MVLLRIARRNLGRNRRRTALTALTIAFGMAVNVWLYGILTARSEDMIETVTRTHAGHLQLADRAFADEEDLQAQVGVPPAELLSGLPPGTAGASRAMIPCLILNGARSTFAQLTGVVPDEERAVTDLSEKVVAGDYAALDGEPGGLCVGRALAELLELAPGDPVTLVTQGPGGAVRRSEARLACVFDSGSVNFERRVLFSPLALVQELAGIDGFHQLVLRLPAGHDAVDVQAAFLDRLPPDLVLTTWREALPEVATLVTFNDATSVFVSRLLLIVVVVGVINTMLMSVYERTWEFGVMASIGTSPVQIVAGIVLEGLLLGIGAAVLGLLLGAAAVYYHQATGFDLEPFLGAQSNAGEFSLELVVHPVFSWRAVANSTAWVVLAVVLSSAFPACMAARQRPIEALRKL